MRRPLTTKHTFTPGGGQHRPRHRFWVVVLLGLCSTIVHSAPRINPGAPAPYTGTIQSSQLYTKTAAPGGISGRIIDPPSQILAIFAISRDKQKTIQTTRLLQGGTRSDAKYRLAVYIATLNDDNSFMISGMAEGIYDLLVLLEHNYYDGLLLNRKGSALTSTDIKTITAKINDSNPYFNEKHIARMAGETGHAAKARVLVQEVRTLPVTLQDGSVHPELQTRSIKLFLMEDVSVTGASAWAAVETREIVRQEVGPPDTKGGIPEFYCKALSGIFVIDTPENLKPIRLTKDQPPEK